MEVHDRALLGGQLFDLTVELAPLLQFQRGGASGGWISVAAADRDGRMGRRSLGTAVVAFQVEQLAPQLGAGQGEELPDRARTDGLQGASRRRVAF